MWKEQRPREMKSFLALLLLGSLCILDGYSLTGKRFYVVPPSCGSGNTPPSAKGPEDIIGISELKNADAKCGAGNVDNRSNYYYSGNDDYTTLITTLYGAQTVMTTATHCMAEPTQAFQLQCNNGNDQLSSNSHLLKLIQQQLADVVSPSKNQQCINAQPGNAKCMVTMTVTAGPETANRPAPTVTTTVTVPSNVVPPSAAIPQKSIIYETVVVSSTLPNVAPTWAASSCPAHVYPSPPQPNKACLEDLLASLLSKIDVNFVVQKP